MSTADVGIRIARPSDAPEIVRVLRASITDLCAADHRGRSDVLDAWLANKTVEHVTTWIADTGAVLLVAIIEGAIAGVACLRGDGHVTLNYVSPDHRFAGVSRALLADMERLARDRALTRLTLESTATALRLYRSAGFTNDSAPSRKHGLAAFPMSKSISPAER